MNLHRTELGLLLTLDTLIETRGVTATARQLGLSQPAVSAQLDKLRRLLGDRILVGNAHGMTPTPLALEIHAELRHHLLALENLVGRAHSFDPHTSVRVFRVLVTDYTQSVLLVPFCKALACVAPGVRLAMQPISEKTAARDLERDADIAVASENMTDPTMPARQLFKEHFRFARRKGASKSDPTIGLEEFCALQHVLVSPTDGGFFGLVDEVLKTQGLKRNVTVSVPFFSAAVELISESEFCGVLPSRVVAAAADRIAEMRPPIELPEFDVLASWHERQANDPGHIWFRNALAMFSQHNLIPVDQVGS